MKGANPQGFALYVSAVEARAYTTHHKGGWHVLLWLGRFDEVNAHLY
jgi:hypothetical protein